MKALNASIIGLLTLTAFGLAIPATHADYCDGAAYNTHYQVIYCGIRLYDNDDLDEELIATLGNQFDMDDEIIKEILDGTICDTVATYTDEEKEELPKPIQNACLTSGKSRGEVLGGWDIFDDIQTSYDKEKVIEKSSQSLKFKFKSSEQYWNGSLTDAPFDLIVDLNLIDIVLFGSKAQWIDDVYSFPDKEEDGGDGEEGLDDLLPDDEDGGGDGDTDGSTDGGGLSTEGGTDGEEPDCVPPDHPDADLGDGPGSQNPNPLCGNGTLDVLLGEQCDDGNKESGDGCNQYCQLEATGAGDMCTDPDAVTFKRPDSNSGGSGSDGDGSGDTSGNGNEDECPPGTVPRKSDVSGEPGAPPSATPQHPEYPGPYLGGTLKQVPPSERPPCPPGEKYLGDDPVTEDPICLDPCGDFEAVREFLFGSLEAYNEVFDTFADSSIDSYFCVDIIEHNRPESPYQMIEGCIDCHITAMVDALDKALQTNVTPLKNTTNAFAISSAHGPAFSFNLSTATKTKVKFSDSTAFSPTKVQANEELAEAREESAPPEKTLKPDITPLQSLRQENREIKAAQQSVISNTDNFRMSTEVIPDQESNNRITPLLLQMKQSFINIQSKYGEMVNTAQALANKDECE